LGIHLTLDLAGQVRLGPDTDWCETQNWDALRPYYDCDWESVKEVFFKAVQAFYPGLQPQALAPGLIGIRPKLFIDGEPHRDFWVKASQNWVDCLGIESPGLTASLALAEEVSTLCAASEMG
jgi:L-2-hydroxyglutarate oxidase LhgO